MDLYRTVGNNPLNSLDPSGLDRIDYHDDGTGQTLVWYVPERWFWQGDGPRQFVGVLVQVNGQLYVRRYIDRQALFIPLHLVEQTTGFWADSVKDWKQWFQQNGQTDLSSTVASGWAQEFGVDLTRTVAELRQTGINAYRDIYIIGTSTAIAMAMVPAGRQLVTTSETAVPRQPIVPSRTVRFVHGVTIKDIRTGKVLTGIVDLQLTLDRIRAGIRFPHCNDGGIFKNKPLPGKTTPELPVKPYGYYREYVPPTPGISGPGPQRLVVGQGGEIYYIPDHYRTFIRVD